MIEESLFAAALERTFTADRRAFLDEVVYLSPADKYHRLTRRLSQEQKGLEERAIMASRQPSAPC